MKARGEKVAGIAFAYGRTVSARIFRLLAGILVGLGALSATPIVLEWIPGIPWRLRLDPSS